jgi:hypothetical protein
MYEICNDFNEKDVMGGKFITNFSNCDIDIYQKAIKKYNKHCKINKLYIRNIAYNNSGYILSDSSSLYSSKANFGLSNFWRIFDTFYKKQISYISPYYPSRPISFKKWLDDRTVKNFSDRVYDELYSERIDWN